MTTVYKYHIPTEDFPTVEMPEGARLLRFELQGDEAYVWAVIDPAAVTRKRRFRMLGTGHQDKGVDLMKAPYVGTVFIDGWALVLHLFDLGEE